MDMPNGKASPGPCCDSVLWMRSEGFFENQEIACSTWIFQSNDKILERVKNLLESTFGDSDDDIDNIEHMDALLAIILVESIKSKEQEKFEFKEEDSEKWIRSYGIAAVMELERRAGTLEVEALDKPLSQTRWRDAKYHGMPWR